MDAICCRLWKIRDRPDSRPEQLAVEEFALLSDSLATVRSESHNAVCIITVVCLALSYSVEAQQKYSLNLAAPARAEWSHRLPALAISSSCSIRLLEIPHPSSAYLPQLHARWTVATILKPGRIMRRSDLLLTTSSCPATIGLVPICRAAYAAKTKLRNQTFNFDPA